MAGVVAGAVVLLLIHNVPRKACSESEIQANCTVMVDAMRMKACAAMVATS